MSSRIRALALALLAAGFSVPAGAVSVQRHTPPGNSIYMFSESGQIGYRGPFFVNVDYDLLNDPLVELTPDRSERIDTLVDSLQTFSFTAGLNLSQLLSLNATLPLNLVHPSGQARSWAVGDTRLFAKVPVTARDSSFQLSVVPELRLPTGNEALFVSNGSASYGVLLAAEQRFPWFSIVGNLGYRRSPDAVFRELDLRQVVPFALGIHVPVTSKLSFGGEFAGERSIPLNGAQNPSELYAGARYQVAPTLALLGGGSVGALSTVPSNDYRFSVALRFEPLLDAAPIGSPPTHVAPVAVTAPSPRETPIQTSQAAPVVLTPRSIEIREEIGFRHDSAELLPRSMRLLDRVAELIAENEERIGNVVIEGHTNELGGDTYNLGLSRRRAAAVADYLADRTDEAVEFRSAGFGKSRPKTGSEKLIRQVRLRVNRRVEIRVEAPSSQSTLQGKSGGPAQDQG